MTNAGFEPVELKKVASMQLDFIKQNMDVISLPGARFPVVHKDLAFFVLEFTAYDMFSDQFMIILTHLVLSRY